MMTLTHEIIKDALLNTNPPIDYCRELVEHDCIDIIGISPIIKWKESFIDSLSISDAYDLYQFVKNSKTLPKWLLRKLKNGK